MLPFDFLLLSCATWYISYVITAQDGPLGLLLRLRQTKGLQGVTSCIYCVTPYVAFTMYGMMIHSGEVVVYGFAIAGASLMLRSYTGAGVHGV